MHEQVSQEELQIVFLHIAQFLHAPQRLVITVTALKFA
jgi:hypothetical protein